MVPKKNSLRIVGGTWLSRRILFADSPDIRPTPDRVRETLFNWLADGIEGARCLDLFAGSGALGFEAASQGALQVTQVDRDASVVAMLELQKQALQARQVEVVCQDALDYVREATEPFDIVFLDPPFATDLGQQVLPVLLARRLISPPGRIYVESPSGSVPEPLDSLHCLREKTAGQVRYRRYALEDGNT